MLQANVAADVIGTPKEGVWGELFGVTSALSAHLSFLALVTNVSSTVKDQQIREVFEKKISDSAMLIVESIANMKWGKSSDFLQALDEIAVRAAFVFAGSDTARIENDVRGFYIVYENNDELQLFLKNVRVSNTVKEEVVRDVFDGTIHPIALDLCVWATGVSYELSTKEKFSIVTRIVQEVCDELIAYVTTAIAMSDEQSERLVRALEKMYDKRVRLNTMIDATIVGGVQVVIGNDFIDGSVAKQLKRARELVLQK